MANRKSLDALRLLSFSPLLSSFFRDTYIADQKQLGILKISVKAWNEWRAENVTVSVYLRGADLRGNLLSNADLSIANLSETNLHGVHLVKADLSGAYLHRADLTGADLHEADLRYANLSNANLTGADLSDANITNADLRQADLSDTYLSRADLEGANLSRAILIGTKLWKASISRCKIYGVSAWDLDTEGAIQKDLVISQDNQPIITLDNLEVAQFVYLLLNNTKIREVIDTIGRKAVLILGRFTGERKAVLDAIREELRKRDYIPILFDFEKPTTRDLTETVSTLAHISRFVIADLSDPHSIPHELMSFGEQLLSVPIQAIFCSVLEHKLEYPMFEHLRRYPHVLPIFRYENQEQLIGALSEKVIEPAEKKVDEMRPKPLS